VVITSSTCVLCQTENDCNMVVEKLSFLDAKAKNYCTKRLFQWKNYFTERKRAISDTNPLTLQLGFTVRDEVKAKVLKSVK